MSSTAQMSRSRTWLATCTVWLTIAASSVGCKQNAATFEPAGSVAGNDGNAGAGGNSSSGGNGGNGGNDIDGDAGVPPTGDAAPVEVPFNLLGHGLPGSEDGTWTYLVYMLGDNNLEHYLLSDLTELMAVGTGGKLTILAQLDRAESENEEPVGGIPNFSGTKRVRVEAGRLTELQDLGEQNLGSGETFSEFVTWGIQAAPADHYALVLWDHGGAWGRFGADSSAQNDGLSLVELSSALDASITSTGLRGPIDLVGFDSCLMGTWEVAVALEGRASYLLASEEVEPGHGWDHRPISILKEEGTTPVKLGSALIDGYAAQARAEGTFSRITLSLTNLNRISYVSDGIHALVRHLSEEGVANHATAVGQSRAAVGAFGTVPRGSTASMVDIQRWATELVQRDPDVVSIAMALELALAKAVVYRIAGDAYPGVGGLSIYFPVVDDRYQGTYDQLEGVDAWRDFVNQFHDAAGSAGDPPSFTNDNGLATLGIAEDGVTVTGSLAAGTFNDIASTTLDFGLYGIDGSAFFLGQKPASIATDGTVRGVWDERVLQISQGDLTDYASYVDDLSSASGIRGLSLPLLFTHDGETTTVVMMLAVDPFGGILSQRFYHHLDAAWAELTPPAGSSFTTLVPTLVPGADAITDQPQSTTFDGDTPVSIQFVSLAAGTNVFVRLQATDYAGQSSSVNGAGTL